MGVRGWFTGSIPCRQVSETLEFIRPLPHQAQSGERLAATAEGASYKWCRSFTSAGGHGGPGDAMLSSRQPFEKKEATPVRVRDMGRGSSEATPAVAAPEKRRAPREGA
jgi:hypothetical protein